MSTKNILKRWKQQKDRIKKENGEKGDIYTLLLEIRNSVSVNFRNNLNWHHKMKFANHIWHCDLICQYIQFLEEELKDTIENLKLAQEGFDERNRVFNLPTAFT